MKLDEFTSELTSALIERKVPENTAAAQVQKLVASLTEDSARLVDGCTKESVAAMADELSKKLLAAAKKPPESRAEDIVEDTGDPDDDIEVIFSRPQSGIADKAPAYGALPQDGGPISAGSGAPFSPATAPQRTPQRFQPFPPSPQGGRVAPGEEDVKIADPGDAVAAGAVSYVLDDGDDISKYSPNGETLARMGLNGQTYDNDAGERREKKTARKALEIPPLPDVKATPEGKKKFFRNAACASPLIAVALILYVALWGAAFIVEGAVIAGLIAALVAIAAIGTLASIFGIIYGIVILSTRHAEGVFEIGLAIVVAGATLLAGVLVYNLALRFMPWVIKKTAFLCKYCTRRIHIAIIEYRGRLSAK